MALPDSGVVRNYYGPSREFVRLLEKSTQSATLGNRPPWRSLLFSVLFAIVAEVIAARWGQQAKLLTQCVIFFSLTMYIVYIGVFLVTGLWRRLIVFTFSAAILSLLSTLVLETTQLKVIAVTCAVGLALLAAGLMSKFYPNSVIDDLLRERSG
jgi:hypothetical protein